MALTRITPNQFQASGLALRVDQLDLNNKTINNVADPIAAQDAATKGYVDAAVGAGGSSTNWLTANNGVNFTTAPSATGSNSIAEGNNATAAGPDDIVIGTNASSQTVGYNIAIGYGAATSTKDSCIAIGLNAKANVSFPYGDGQTVIGSSANGWHRNTVAIGRSTDAYGDAGVAIGYNAQQQGTGANAVALGDTARTYQAQSTALGSRALLFDQTGTATGYANTTGVGYDARVSAANQVQLGNSLTTTYAYGAVQNRSDARDKTDITDIQLGLNFLNQLRPVNFRWDYRDDYIEQQVDANGDPVLDANGNPIVNILPKDGSRKRTRLHNGFIAQEVKSAADALGIDFAGYQDHSLSGGTDVKTIGYEEFIPIIVKAIQEIDARSSGGVSSVFHAYDANGGTALSTIENVYIGVPWDTVARNDTSYTLSADGTEITINEAGWYDIEYGVTIEDNLTTNVTNRVTVRGRMSVNSGLSYSEMEGTQSSCYIRNANNDEGTLTARRVVQLNAGDKIKVEVTVGHNDTFGQAPALKANGSRIVIIKI